MKTYLRSPFNVLHSVLASSNSTNSNIIKVYVEGYFLFMTEITKIVQF